MRMTCASREDSRRGVETRAAVSEELASRLGGMLKTGSQPAGAWGKGLRTSSNCRVTNGEGQLWPVSDCAKRLTRGHVLCCEGCRRELESRLPSSNS